jgi:hypothetical protein
VDETMECACGGIGEARRTRRARGKGRRGSKLFVAEVLDAPSSYSVPSRGSVPSSARGLTLHCLLVKRTINKLETSHTLLLLVSVFSQSGVGCVETLSVSFRVPYACVQRVLMSYTDGTTVSLNLPLLTC